MATALYLIPFGCFFLFFYFAIEFNDESSPSGPNCTLRATPASKKNQTFGMLRFGGQQHRDRAVRARACTRPGMHAAHAPRGMLHVCHSMHARRPEPTRTPQQLVLRRRAGGAMRLGIARSWRRSPARTACPEPCLGSQAAGDVPAWPRLRGVHAPRPTHPIHCHCHAFVVHLLGDHLSLSLTTNLFALCVWFAAGPQQQLAGGPQPLSDVPS